MWTGNISTKSQVYYNKLWRTVVVSPYEQGLGSVLFFVILSHISNQVQLLYLLDEYVITWCFTGDKQHYSSTNEILFHSSQPPLVCNITQVTETGELART